jgi:tripartite-type tricarboxylate transporter receptor subunit TctC
MASMPHIKSWLVLLACLAALPALSQTGGAKPLRMVVGFPPGGTSDILARTLAAHLPELLGVPVVVENRTGAGGNIAAELVAKSAPDGATVMMATTSQAISQSLYAKLGYDLLRDFTPVSQAANYANLLVVHPSIPVRTVDELLGYARSSPKGLHYGSAGNGTPPHMTGEMFKGYTGIALTHVPYKGGAPAIADLIGGQIVVLFDNVPPLLSHVRSGRMRAIAVTSLKRISVLPDTPTLDEAGLKGFDSVGWNGVIAPAGTPPETVQRLSDAIAKLLRRPDIRDALIAQGAEPVGSTPEAFGSWMRAEVQKWAKVVRDSGAKVD